MNFENVVNFVDICIPRDDKWLVGCPILTNNLRLMSACIRRTAVSHPKFAFTPTFIFCIPICPYNCGVVFFVKYSLVFDKWFFSFDRSNMQIFTMIITRVVWSHVTNILDLRYFCQHNPFFYHLNLIPCHYWSWQSNICFWWIFLSDILFLCQKVTSKQRQF